MELYEADDVERHALVIGNSKGFKEEHVKYVHQDVQIIENFALKYKFKVHSLVDQSATRVAVK